MSRLSEQQDKITLEDPKERGYQIFNELKGMLELLQRVPSGCECDNYRAYLHGQIYALTKSLRIMFPGPDNLGEKASLAVRPVLTEHRCECTE